MVHEQRVVAGADVGHLDAGDIAAPQPELEHEGDDEDGAGVHAGGEDATRSFGWD